MYRRASEVAPAAGSYLAESDYFDANWKQSFWGPHYQRLAAISSFFTYAIKRELLPGPNPLDRIDRADRQDYADVAPHELPAMKRHLAEIDRATLEGARDDALLSVALLTGRLASAENPVSEAMADDLGIE